MCIQKTVQVRSSASMTTAIINAGQAAWTSWKYLTFPATRLQAPAVCGSRNPSLNLGPFDVSIGSSEHLLHCFQQCTLQGGDPLHQLLPGMVSALYLQNRAPTPTTSVAAASARYVSANTSYTLYIFNAPNATDGLKTLVVSN
ncbi:MAG: hypothetical protein ACLR0U_20165 [Enterocloster clostridioformis]